MNINEAMILPGGWHYKCDAYRIPHKGELPNPKEVISGIMTYRLENNLPVGDPEGDLEEYVCANFPAWCRRAPGEPIPVQTQQGTRNVDLVLMWANEFYTKVGRLQLVPQKEADERAAICASCPLQMDWANDCPPCVTSAQRLMAILRQGKDTIEGNLGGLRGCHAHGWDNRTAVHIDKQHLPPQANPNAPAQCWMRK